MTEIRALACHKNGSPLEQWKYVARDLGENDVEIDITHCGICYSDIHTLDSDWGPTNYPVVPGHEIAGVVISAGAKSKLKKGDRVGVGAQVWACHKNSCEHCSHHRDTMCESRVFTYNANYLDGKKAYGGYADRVRVSSDYTFLLPDALTSAEAAPLLCAGATVFTPLKRTGVTSGSRVGVAGIGGLGHLAVQFASKMGAEVFALSHSANKREEAKHLGATHFIDISKSDEVTAQAGKLDVLIITSNHENQPWDVYFSLLRSQGTLCLLAVPAAPIQFHAASLILRELKMMGTLIATRELIVEMLAFAAKHQVKAMTELMPMSQVNKALDHVRSGKVRYRVVLEKDFK